MKGVKVIGGNRQKDLVKSFEHLFSPNPNNVHLYIEKTYKLSKMFKKLNALLSNISTSLVTSKIGPVHRQAGDLEIHAAYRVFKKHLKAAL